MLDWKRWGEELVEGIIQVINTIYQGESINFDQNTRMIRIDR